MVKINLKSKAREITGKKVKQYRKIGMIPAVSYGKGIEPKNLLVNALDFKKVYDQAGENTIIELSVDEKEKMGVLIHEIQTNPLTGNISHIDFFRIKMDEKIETEIPIKFFGEALAVRDLRGVLVKNIDEIPVSCLPADLPQEFKIDLSGLKTFDDRIKVGDIEISDKVKIMVEPETIIASVAPPRSDEEMEALDEKVEADVSKVEKAEGKEDKEDEDKEEIKEESAEKSSEQSKPEEKNRI